MKHEKKSATTNRIVTEWEDTNMFPFDIDDPDFCNSITNLQESQLNNSVLRQASSSTIQQQQSQSVLNTIPLSSSYSFKVPPTMSLASLHNFADFYPSMGHNNSISLSSSLSDLVGSPIEISMDSVISIEELRSQMGSCFTCGVSWVDDHVSLDCSECGGYSLERPCPLCDGNCGVQWKRDFTMSHTSSKARWLGVCPSYPEAALNDTSIVSSNVSTITAGAPSCAAANQLLLAKELCARLEQLSTQT